MILRELEREPDHWFWALQSIPVEPEQRGRLTQMAGIWIQWGKEHGYRCRQELYKEDEFSHLTATGYRITSIA